LALDLAHAADQLFGAGRKADAPAGHAIGLGDAIAGQRARIKLRLDLRGGAELEPVIGQMFVHVVGHHPDMGMAQQHIGQRAQLVPAVARPGGVRGRIEDEPAGLRCDRGLERACRQLETGLDPGGYDHRFAPRKPHHVGVADPVGRGDHHLVAGVHRRHQGVVEDLLAARGHADLRGGVIQPVIAPELGADRVLQLGDAVDGGVFRAALLDRADARRLDVVRRVEIRLARAQPDHVAPLRLQFLRFRRHRDGGRGFHTR